MASKQQCGAPGCGDPAAVSFQKRALCASHFISTSYERIDEYTRALSANRFPEGVTEAIWEFVVECTERAADVTQSGENLDNLQRARLLDILLSAAELGRHIRRSPRWAACMPVCLRCEKLGRAWEEETHTKVLSRYGALVECRHPVEINDALVCTRLDTGQAAKAHVVWKKQGPPGVLEVGIELLNCDNFWGVDWSSAGFVPPQTGGTLESAR